MPGLLERIRLVDARIVRAPPGVMSNRYLPEDGVAVSRTSTGDRAQQPALAAQWPLVGRDSELGRLRGLISGQRRGVVLAGPAGVGKTRLSLELIELAER